MGVIWGKCIIHNSFHKLNSRNLHLYIKRKILLWKKKLYSESWGSEKNDMGASAFQVIILH